MRFTKMHGIGNNYLYVNLFEETVENPNELSRRMSDVRFGAGSDGLVLIGPSDCADFRMRIFNRDGSEGEMCGNATRCVAKYVYERGMTGKTEVTLETNGGIKILKLTVTDGKVTGVTVDMGEPILSGEKIPVALEGEPVVARRAFLAGEERVITCVNTGNPHCVLFVEDAEHTDIAETGSAIENDPLFPLRTNVEFVTVEDRTHLRMRVWERGSGITMACGTGACAALVAAVLNGYTERKATVRLDGGELTVEWDEKTNRFYQTGPAEFVYDGEWLQ
ncbi:MAG: diaminopimelate epimerase [Clostridia bacterium]|nr:diaminopimelate epimerase [Clostridia bacterium]